MNVSLFQAASALNANQRWQEIIADNLASSSVPGFKRQELSLATVKAGLMPGSGISGGNQYFTIPKATTATNFQPGELNYTGLNTDAALDGHGFFNVKLPTGQNGFTREGEFQVNSHSQLVTKEGYLVLGQAGPIQMDRTNHDPISISAAGDVSQGATIRARLKLVDFNKPELLTQVSGSYFISQNPALKEQASTAAVRGGYVEGSNASSLNEMSGLLTAMRGFEANQHVIQIQDDRMGKTIADLGNPS